MTTKLTLSISEEVVAKAKEISRRKGKSLSKMVEEYLSTLAEKEAAKESVVKKMSGSLKGKIPADTDWKKIKAEYLAKKYGI